MSLVASRELRNNTRSVLERVEAGESITITVDGRPVAVLKPVDGAPRWMAREQFFHHVLAHQADAGLLEELRRLTPDTTDDVATR